MVKPTKVGKEQRLPNFDELLLAAQASRTRAYAPYSKYAVGAAVLGSDGKLYSGCNVENASYGLTICAERNAIFSAIANGCREFEKIAIVADTKEPISPCGACRQVLAEFNPNMEIILANFQGKTETFHLSELLPRSKKGILGHS